VNGETERFELRKKPSGHSAIRNEVEQEDRDPEDYKSQGQLSIISTYLDAPKNMEDPNSKQIAADRALESVPEVQVAATP
jgi:hypothetical protein